MFRRIIKALEGADEIIRTFRQLGESIIVGFYEHGIKPRIFPGEDFEIAPDLSSPIGQDPPESSSD